MRRECLGKSIFELKAEQETKGDLFTCLLGSHNEELGEPITGFLLGPDIFVPLVITGILKARPRLL